MNTSIKSQVKLTFRYPKNVLRQKIGFLNNFNVTNV